MAFDYVDSDSSYGDEGPPLPNNTNVRNMMNLRKTERLKRPVRYRDDLEPLDPGRPIFVHQDPIFNMDRAKFVQWCSLELNEPSPGENLYKEWQEQGQPRDAFGAPIVPPHGGEVQQPTESSPRPTVAHLRRQSPPARPDLTQPVAGPVKYKDEFDKAFEANLVMFELEDDGDEPSMNQPQPNSDYQDWSALGHNVQWAMIYDLAHDHEDGITTAANLLGLTIDEVINFVNLYMREKAQWDNYTDQDEPTYPTDGLFQLDGVQYKADQPAPEAEVDQIMRDFEPVQQDLSAEATQTVELFTDNFSREDIGSGRGYLSFVGLQDYADRFGEWFGKTTTFRDIPGIFNENNELIFSTEDAENALYRGNELAWQGPAPQFEKVSAQRKVLPEALPQDPAQDKEPAYPPFGQLEAMSEQINGHPTSRFGQNDKLFDYVPERTYGGPGHVEAARAAIVADLFAEPTSEKGVEGATRKEVDGRVGSNVGQSKISKSQGKVGGLGDDGARLFNTNSAIQPHPEMPQFNNGLTPRFLKMQHASISQSFNMSKNFPLPYAPPFLQSSSFSRPHGSIAQPTGDAATASAPLGHTSSHVSRSTQASQAQIGDHSSATPDTKTPRPMDTSLKPEVRKMSEETMAEGTHDASVSDKPAPDEVGNRNAKSDQQKTKISENLSNNGIEVDTFPKCFGCFRVRARCLGGRPCGTCIRRGRKCRPVTKEDLDELPERAERVLKDKAKADRKKAEAGGSTIVPGDVLTPDPVVSAPAASSTATAGTKRKQSAMTGGGVSTPDPVVSAPATSKIAILGTKQKQWVIIGGVSSDENDSDLDAFPPEKEDPNDSDYDIAPKKKKKLQKKGENSVGKKQTPRQAKSGVPTTPTPKAPTPAAPAPKTPTPTKRRGSYREKGETATPKRDEPLVGTTGTPTRTSAEKASAGKVVTASSRYVDMSFAPLISAVHTMTPSFIPGTPVTQFSRPGPYDSGLQATPSWDTQSMPLEPDHPVPPRPVVSSAESELFGGAQFSKTASGLNTSTGQEMLPLTTDRMSMAPKMKTDRPRSLSSNSGTTVSMDFLNIPAQEPPVHRDVSMLGGLGQSGSRHQSMPGFTPNSSARMMPMDSSTASQRRQSVSSYNNGVYRSGNSVSPMMLLNQGFTMPSELMSPYAMSQQQRSVPRPISEMQQAPGHPAPQHMMAPSTMSGFFFGPQIGQTRSGPRDFSSYSSSEERHGFPPRPAKRPWDSPMYPGQQPATKKSKVPASPMAPPREARSWKELAHNQWATETYGSQLEPANFSTERAFGGDGPFDVSFSQFTGMDDQTEQEF